MKNELIPLFHKLGLIQAVWLHTNTDKFLTVVRYSPYGKWAFKNNEHGGWAVTLLEGGRIANFPGEVTHWSYYRTGISPVTPD